VNEFPKQVSDPAAPVHRYVDLVERLSREGCKYQILTIGLEVCFKYDGAAFDDGKPLPVY
jgi:hypothetical protein